MTTISKKVIITPGVLYAFIDRLHPKHIQATAFFRYFASDSYHLYMDNLSIYETYRLLMDSMSPSLAREALRSIYLSNITILYPDDSDMRSAIKYYLSDKSNELNLNKSLLGVLADKNHIPQICTLEYMPSMFGLTLFYIPV